MADTFSRGIEFSIPQYPVAANTLIEAGDMVAISQIANATKGYAVPATLLANLKVKGIATKRVDNRTGNTDGNSGLAGGAVVPVELAYGDKGLRTHKVLNDTVAPVVQATVGTVCYVKDAKTVSLTSTSTSVAAEVFRLDTDVVYVIFNQ